MQDALTDPRCLVTPESLLIDGANGVCRDARLGSREDGALRFAGLLLGAVVFAAYFVARRPSFRARSALLSLLVIASAIPGGLAMFAERADRPTRVHATAAASMQLHDVVRAFAVQHGCARTTLDQCASCAPVVRLALAGLHCDEPASIELHADAFTGICEERGSTLVCGAL